MLSLSVARTTTETRQEAARWCQACPARAIRVEVETTYLVTEIAREQTSTRASCYPRRAQAAARPGVVPPGMSVDLHMRSAVRLIKRDLAFVEGVQSGIMAWWTRLVAMVVVVWAREGASRSGGVDASLSHAASDRVNVPSRRLSPGMYMCNIPMLLYGPGRALKSSTFSTVSRISPARQNTPQTPRFPGDSQPFPRFRGHCLAKLATRGPHSESLSRYDVGLRVCHSLSIVVHLILTYLLAGAPHPICIGTQYSPCHDTTSD